MSKCAVVLLLFASLLSAAKKPPARDWKEATLKETAFATEEVGAGAQAMAFPGWGPYAPTTVMGGARRIVQRWQGFRLEDGSLTLMVACLVKPKRMPNVTVNTTVRYAMERGKFYLLDEDGHEFQMVVLQKAIKPATSTSAPPAK